MDLLIVAMGAAVLSIAGAVFLYFYVVRQEPGNAKMQEVAHAIEVGADAFLRRQYRALALFSAVLAILFAVTPQLGVKVAFAYVIGSFCSGFAGYLGMRIAVKANVRTAHAAQSGLNAAFPIAFRGGAVMGLLVVGIALLGISVLYYVFRDIEMILGFSFGASTIALFAKAGGGIFTKTADIGADLVGKVEMDMDEDDPRNPAVVADNVGDNVGDVAGMGADLYDSYVAGVLAAMVIGFASLGVQGAVYPIMIKAAGVMASLIGVALVRVKPGGDPGNALNNGSYIACGIFAVMAYVVTRYMGLDMRIFYATLAGPIVGTIIGLTSDYYTSTDHGPTRETAYAAQTGAAINILSGFSYGSISVMPPLVGIACTVVIAHWLAGLFGIVMASVGIMATAGMIVSADAYGPIVDNAKGIAEQAGLDESVIKIADKLDEAGNTAKAITKGFAAGAAGITVIALLASYAELVGIRTLDIMNPIVMAGILIGISMPPVLSALLILGVEKNAHRMVEEIRRQFRDIKGLKEGLAKPDYASCVDIATKGALREVLAPSALAIVSPVVVGLSLGIYALGGFLAGTIFSGLVFAFLMSNAGGLWDNAKKLIEDGAYGGKRSEAHKAAVVGDTVGDPFKDTAGPSMNTMITVMSLTASLFAPFIVKYALIK